jgi:hypothetical protein
VIAASSYAAFGPFHDDAGSHPCGEHSPRPALALSRYRHESDRSRGA